uniref:Uncharacterized protein n=3 Tax=Meloidogyne incognita group TaxID=654580 RepID=A0A914KU28_MELIC
MKQLKITSFLAPKNTDVGVQTVQPNFPDIIKKYPFFLTTPNPAFTPTWGVVQNAVTGKYLLSTVDPLPDIFWVRISKNSLTQVTEAIKNMDCVEVFGGQIHPFMDSVDAEEMQPVWKGQEDNESMREIETVVENSLGGSSVIDQNSSINEWSPLATSTPRESPVSMYYANSSPALIREPYLADYLQEDESFF